MIKIEFTESEKELLNYERYNHYHPRVQQKMEVLWLKSFDLPHELICKIGNVSPNTMRSYFKDYQEGKIEKLKRVNFYKPESKLKSSSDVIEEHFRKNPPRSLSEASAVIEELTGIKRSLPQVKKFISDLGMQIRKVGSIPGKALDREKKRNKKDSYSMS